MSECGLVNDMSGGSMCVFFLICTTKISIDDPVTYFIWCYIHLFDIFYQAYSGEARRPASRVSDTAGLAGQ